MRERGEYMVIQLITIISLLALTLSYKDEWYYLPGT